MKKFKIRMKQTVNAKFGVTLTQGKTYRAQESIPNKVSVFPYDSNTLLVTVDANKVEKVK